MPTLRVPHAACMTWSFTAWTFVIPASCVVLTAKSRAGANTIWVLTIFGWTACMMVPFFYLLKLMGMLRVTPEEEMVSCSPSQCQAKPCCLLAVAAAQTLLQCPMSW